MRVQRRNVDVAKNGKIFGFMNWSGLRMLHDTTEELFVFPKYR